MMTPDITIPPEAVEAARVAWQESASDYTRLDDSIRAALRAGIAAWPGVEADRILRARNDGSAVAEPRIVLPLPQDTRDE